MGLGLETILQDCLGVMDWLEDSQDWLAQQEHLQMDLALHQVRGCLEPDHQTDHPKVVEFGLSQT
jgi:hypothetical protein